jgi:tRNA threonylcarbamoyladenosine biosynthesis protein TsaB
MNVIGIDTTTRAFCMALVQEEKVLERIRVDDTGYHSEELLVYLQGMLQRQDLSKEDIDGYAISIGPGSLTGVRVGLAFLKGIGFAMGKPVVPVETLYAIARGARESGDPVCVALSTKRDRLFWAAYEFSPQDTVLCGISCTTIEELLTGIPLREMFFIGSAAHLYKERIRERLGELARFGQQSVAHADPAVIAAIGLEKIRKGDIPALDTLEPIYL